MARSARVTVTLPLREFLYTFDQLALILNIEISSLTRDYIFFEGVTAGSSQGRMRARDIAPPNAAYRDWRVAESSFRMFLRRRGWQVIEPHLSG